MWNHTFAIFKVSYNPSPNQAVGGICGTCFFVTEKDFITAHHCFNNDNLQPNPGYQTVKVFLVNEERVIHSPKIKGLHPEYDLTIGTIENKVESWFSDYATLDKPAGKQVFNIGYPHSRSVKNAVFNMMDSNLEITNIELVPEKQEGTIERVVTVTCNALDIKFKNRKTFVLDYTSELGFSGGPLILETTNQLLGFMSLVLPKKTDLDRRAVAIPIDEVRQFL